MAKDNKVEFNKDYIILDKKVNAHIENTSNPHKVTKADVELGNVDNTADLDKPISKAEQKEIDRLDARIDAVDKYKNKYDNLTKLSDYFYLVDYIALDYEVASDYFKEDEEDIIINTSNTLRAKDFVGRNVDSRYDKNVDFLVRTKAFLGRYATMGFATRLKTLTEEFVNSRTFTPLFATLPFNLTEGINDKGLFASVDYFIPNSTERQTKKAFPSGKAEVELSTSMVVRYILDHFENALDAITYLEEHAEIYMAHQTAKNKLECQWFVSDLDGNTYLLQILKREDNSQYLSHIEITDIPVVTNFSKFGIKLGTNSQPDSKIVYTPATKERISPDYDEYWDADTYNNIRQAGIGLETYNNLINALPNLNVIEELEPEDLQRVVENILFTKCYTDNPELIYKFLFTNYDGDWDGKQLKVNSSISEFLPIIAEQKHKYLIRSRDSSDPGFGTKQTLHSCVYDLRSQKVYIKIQENLEIEFSFYITDKFQDELELIKKWLEAKQDKLTAGEGIKIDENATISVDLTVMSRDELNTLFNLKQSEADLETHTLVLNGLDWVLNNSLRVHEENASTSDQTINLED